MKRLLTALVAAWIASAARAPAQFAVPPPGPPVEFQFSIGLEELLGRVALYPDPLLAQILSAATVPAEIVLAERYVGGGGNPALIDQQPWDSSVKALARYPAVLKMLDDNLAWTTDLGQAFLNQPEFVMSSIQHLRAQAQDFGNLNSSPQETVIAEDGIIEILPANPQVIYVPVYQPEAVFFQPSYGRTLTSFGAGYALGAWLDRDFDWQQGNIILWDRDHPRPASWWARKPIEHPRTEPTHFTVLDVPHMQPAVPWGIMDRGWYESEMYYSYASGSVPAPDAGGSTLTVIHPGYSAGPGPGPVFMPTFGGTVPVTTFYSATASSWGADSGVLIGMGSSRETREFSERGRHSREGTGRDSGHAHAGGHGGSHGGSGRH